MHNDKKEIFMQAALKQAKKALEKGEVPIGAVIVDVQGKIIAQAYNKVEIDKTQTSHAEALAIKKVCKKIGDWRLNGCWMYVTLEPCLMCFGLIQLSRMAGIIYGAKSTLFGCSLSDVQKLPTYAKNMVVQGGVKELESLDLLKKFFGKLRRPSK
ncbi:MAG: nucleoside deaminase [bacterium]